MTASVDWVEVEALAERDEQERVDRVRVRGYTLACIRRVDGAKVELERAVSCLENARSVAEKAMKRLHAELEHAEDMGRIVALDDPEVNERLALALERLEEVE